MRTLTHLVVTDNFAGVERYVTVVSRIAADHGWHVRVLGGREREMRRELPTSVEWAPAPTTGAALRALRATPRADLLHVHMTSAEIAAAVVPRGRRVLATRHFAAVPGSTAPARLAARLAARRLDAVVAVSDTVRRASGDPAMPVLLLGVPLNERERDPGRTVVVTQRLEQEKRTLDAVRAFARSGLAADGWSLEVYGEGAEAGAVRAELEAAGVGAGALRGWSEDVPSVLSRAGIVLAPADGEPFGLAVAEAMAAGAPVVAAAAAGHLETVGAVRGARTFVPRDPDDAARVLRALADESLAAREAYGASLREFQRSHLDADGHGAGLLALYERVLATDR